MPRFAANLSMLFREYPMLERPLAARQAGFDLVEILFPYDEPAPRMRAALDRAETGLVLINCPPPNYTGGARGMAAVPGLEERFRYDFRRVLRYAEVLEPTHIHIMSGEAARDAAAFSTFVDNLKWAAREAPGQSLTIEPINPQDMEGYYLSDFDLAAEVLDAVSAPNLNLQFDAYHAHKITSDVLATWALHGARAVHIQISGAEGRHEPMGGAIDYPAFFETLDTSGYKGVVSAEYTPARRTEDGLGWLTTVR